MCGTDGTSTANGANGTANAAPNGNSNNGVCLAFPPVTHPPPRVELPYHRHLIVAAARTHCRVVVARDTD